MPARLNPRNTEAVRLRIQAAKIVDKLQMHIDDECELKPTQLTAAMALLDRAVPKLQQIQLTGENDGPLKIEVVKFAEVANAGRD